MKTYKENQSFPFMLGCFFLYQERVFARDGLKGFIHEHRNFTGFVGSFVHLLHLDGFGERIINVLCFLSDPGLFQTF